MRLSGIMLLLRAVGHMLLQHVFRDVHNLTLQVVQDVWRSWGWRAYDLLLLIFAILHGLNGLRQILEDFINKPQTVKIVNRVLLVVVVLTIVWSAVAIFSFNPEAVMAAAE